MNEYYKVSITKTSKPWGPHKTCYHTFSEHTETFTSIEDVKSFLADEYAKPCKKSKIYQDGSDGETNHIGWVYHLKDEYERIWLQHWVVVCHIQSTPVTIF